MTDETVSVSFVGRAAPAHPNLGVATAETSCEQDASPNLKPGEILSDRFVVERLAGSGGMGVVYRGLDRVSGHPVAIKIVNGHGPAEERFAREARVLANLRHHAIVRYVAHGETARRQPYLVMDWLEGEDLAQRLLRSRLTVSESLDVARRVAEGLAVAHERHVVHRDIKPNNIFLVDGEPTRATLIDFGIARTELRRLGRWRVGSRARESCWAPSDTCRRSRRSGTSCSMRARTCSRSAVCYSSA